MSAVSSIPRYPSDVTAAWLADVLARRGTITEVASVDVAPVGTGQTGATFRVAATYATNPHGLPDSFILKLPSGDDAVRDRVSLGYRSECAFYQSVADRVTIPIPDCFHCEITDEGASYALLLADQAPAVQGDQIAGCGVEEARLAVRALAGLHGPTWCDPHWQSFEGLAMSITGEDAIRGMGEVSKMAADITVDKLKGKLSDADAETLVAAMALVTPWLLNAPDRFALLHGDYRLDNLLFDGDRVAVVDWQTLGIGLAGRDLAYFTGTSLEPDCARRGGARPGRRLPPGPAGAGRRRLRPGNLLAGLPPRHDPGPVDLRAGVRFLDRNRTRRRHDGRHAAPGLPGHPRPGDPRARLPPSRSTHGPNPAAHSDHRCGHQRTDVGQDAQGLRGARTPPSNCPTASAATGRSATPTD